MLTPAARERRECLRAVRVFVRRLSASAAVANIALVKADKARKIEDLLIMNAQRGAASRIIAAGEVTRWQV